MKAYGGVDVYINIFLTSALVEDERSASRPGPLYPWERSPGTHWIGGWLGSKTGLDDIETRKFFLLPGLELRLLGRPVRSITFHIRTLIYMDAHRRDTIH
jgi:hypothetical protein